MKGNEYEQFAFDKFKQLFPNATVTKNDYIRGSLSDLDREIDVSIKMTVESQHLLYIVQCKDWKTPADIKVLGEFSAVIRDVQAAKGFLLCTSGFAKSNYKYALTLGIELVTIEDIKSDKWTTNIQIPVVYIRKINHYSMDFRMIVNEALVSVAENSKEEFVIQLSTETLLTNDEGNTTISYKNYLNESIESLEATSIIGVEKNICRPNLHILIAGVWVPCDKFSFTLLDITKKYYLKYVTPEEYSHLRDHVRETIHPIHIIVNNSDVVFDGSFIELPEAQPPVILGLFLEIEEWTLAENAQKMTSNA